MLNDRQLATMLAALWYWREEMALQHLDIQEPYFHCQGLDRYLPLTVGEVLELAQLLHARITGFDPSTDSNHSV